MADLTAVATASPFRATLRQKIAEISELEKTYDWQKLETFLASTSMLLARILEPDSPELTQFRNLDGRSSFISALDFEREERDREAYTRDLQRARAILTAVDESLDWQAPTNSADNVIGAGKANEPDDVNQAVLDFVFDLMQQHPHRAFGWTERELQNRMSDQFGPSEVALAVKFLSGVRLLTHTTRQRIKYYELSSKALNIYRPSKFMSRPLSSIQINNMNGVLVMNDNLGTITQTNTEGIQDLDQLIDILKTSSIPQGDKREVIADVETVKTQLTKQHPDSSIISRAWASIVTSLQATGLIAQAAENVEKIRQLLSPHIH